MKLNAQTVNKTIMLSQDLVRFTKEIHLVGFYEISPIVGYLIPNPVYSYMLNI